MARIYIRKHKKVAGVLEVMEGCAIRGIHKSKSAADTQAKSLRAKKKKSAAKPKRKPAAKKRTTVAKPKRKPAAVPMRIKRLQGKVKGLKKSNGHLGWYYFGNTVFELYRKNGELWRAPLTNVIEVGNGFRFGRFEAPDYQLQSTLKRYKKLPSPVVKKRTTAKPTKATQPTLF